MTGGVPRGYNACILVVRLLCGTVILSFGCWFVWCDQGSEEEDGLDCKCCCTCGLYVLARALLPIALDGGAMCAAGGWATSSMYAGCVVSWEPARLSSAAE